ncbi:hypothetical protein [Oceanicoccus sp. KOV_DT_Chl]|nr:hypothetical protein [Oceanicoccus sp. KOV_DT_Chl]
MNTPSNTQQASNQLKHLLPEMRRLTAEIIAFTQFRLISYQRSEGVS